MNELWRFIPATYYNSPGRCYDPVGNGDSGCLFRGCRFSGKVQFWLTSSFVGDGSGPRGWVIGENSGSLVVGERTPWLSIKYNVGCGDAFPPQVFAYDLYAPSEGATSGWAFRCGPCVKNDGGDEEIIRE